MTNLDHKQILWRAWHRQPSQHSPQAVCRASASLRPLEGHLRRRAATATQELQEDFVPQAPEGVLPQAPEGFLSQAAEGRLQAPEELLRLLLLPSPPLIIAGGQPRDESKQRQYQNGNRQ